MKKIVILSFMLFAGLAAWSQNHQYQNDSAAMVVERYLNLLNYQAIPADTMLYIETYIYLRSNPKDTVVMKRWYWAPYCFRTEIWHKDTLTNGYRTNSYDLYQHWQQDKHRWFKQDVAVYFSQSDGYDFRGPFKHWKTDRSRLRYDGVWNFNGREAYRIFVSSPDYFDRYYMFEKETGLLFMVDELDSYMENFNNITDHIDWCAVHEYTPLGDVLFPTVESFQANEDIVLMFHNYKYVPVDKDIFVK